VCRCDDDQPAIAAALEQSYSLLDVNIARTGSVTSGLYIDCRLLIDFTVSLGEIVELQRDVAARNRELQVVCLCLCCRVQSVSIWVSCTFFIVKFHTLQHSV
jgi:hypothetical protein